MGFRLFVRLQPIAGRAAALCLAALAAACASAPQSRDSGGPVASGKGHYKVGAPYRVSGKWYYPAEDADYAEVGIASWYGDAFHGKPTANGEVFDMNRLSAAHTTLPLPSLVEVENLENGRSIVLRLNDRGPFVDDRLIDLSRAAARELGFLDQGLARVRVRYVGRADLGMLAAKPGDRRNRQGTSETVRVAAAPQTAPSPRVVSPIPVAAPLAGKDPDLLVSLIETAEATPAPEPSAWWVHLDAIDDLDVLKDASIAIDHTAPLVVTSGDYAGDVRRHLHLGPFASREEAESGLAAAVNAGFNGARLTRVEG